MRYLKWVPPLFFSLASFSSFLCAEEAFVPKENLNLWTETFGEKDAQPLLLIMAGGVQGIMWPEAFCQLLATEGYFVIRYDHRDMGLSSSVDYEKNPYDLMDLARDAIAILDFYHIQKAHLLGLSMGGNISQLLAVHFPTRVASIASINSTRDLASFLEPLNKNSSLSGPNPEYLSWKQEFNNALEKGISAEEKIEFHLKGWKLLNGKKAPFDETLYRKLVVQSMKRAKNPQGFNNHLLAMKASKGVLKELPSSVSVPYLVLHGTESPIFSLEHAKDLAQMLPQAHLKPIAGLGHFLNPLFYGELAKSIKTHIEKTRRIPSEKIE